MSQWNASLASLILISIFCSPAIAQQNVALRRPTAKAAALDLSAYFKCIGPQSGRSSEYWRVWTDRENTPVYADQTLSSPTGAKLKFLEAFYVAAVSNNRTGMLLIRSKSEPFAERIEPDETIGWVRTENLLLNTASARSESFVPKRAVAIPSDRRPLMARAAPDTNATPVNTLSDSGSFSYIYKYDECSKQEWFLVGRRTALSAFGEAQDIILGWIPSSVAVEWNTREAYEPSPNRYIPLHIYKTEAALRTSNLDAAVLDRFDRGPWQKQRMRLLRLSPSSSAREAEIAYPEQLDPDSKSSGPGFRRGWVKLNDPAGNPTVESVYLVGMNELLNSIRLLQEFGTSAGTDTAGLVNTWRGLIERVCECSTQKPPTLDQFLLMGHGVAIRRVPTFLDRDWEDVSRARPEEIRTFINLTRTAIDKLQKLRFAPIWFKDYGEEFAWIAAADLP